jgi:hypothetical protein
MSDKPPPFANYLPVSSDDIWKKVLSGEVPAFIYSAEARGDFEPVPISAAEISMADEDGRAASDDDQVWPEPKLKPHQILWRDSDRRRPSARRRGIRVPHWVYVMKADISAKNRGAGAAEQFDWADIELLVRKLFADRGDFAKPENRVLGWRSQNDLIEAVKDYLEKRHQPVPGETRFKAKVAEMLKRIRLELLTGH